MQTKPRQKVYLSGGVRSGMWGIQPPGRAEVTRPRQDIELNELLRYKAKLVTRFRKADTATLLLRRQQAAECFSLGRDESDKRRSEVSGLYDLEKTVRQKHSPEEEILPSNSIEALIRSVLESSLSVSSEAYRWLRMWAVSAFHPDREVSWEDLNQRRLNLIEKDIDQSLTPAEEAELRDLQQKAEEYLDTVAPLPFRIFEKLKECAAKDGLSVKLDENE